MNFTMKITKYKHLSFEDRCVIEEFLNHNYNFTQIANRLGRHRTAISKEVLKHRFLRGTASSNRPCCFDSKPPFSIPTVRLPQNLTFLTNAMNTL